MPRHKTMTDTTDNTAAQLAALLAQMQAAQTTTQQPAAPAGGWNQPRPVATAAEVQGVAVPLSLETPAGKIRVYLSFPAACAANPAALLGLIEQLHQAGYPLDVWKPKTEGEGWGTRQGGNWNGGSRGNTGWRR